MIKTEDELRNILLNEFDKNYMVEAGAGAGKTTIIISRIINQILSEDKRFARPLRLDEIAAITFTEKAASELKQKIMKKLYRARDESKIEKEKQILKEAIDLIDDQYVGTIHSFCKEILVTSGYESSIGSDFKLIEPTEDLEIKELVWRKYIVKEQSNLKDLFKKINDQDMSISVAKSAFMTLVNYEHAHIEFDVDLLNRGDGFKDLKELIDEFLNNFKILDDNTLYTKKNEDISDIFLKKNAECIKTTFIIREKENYYTLAKLLIKDSSFENLGKKAYIKKKAEYFEELFTCFEGKDLNALYKTRYHYIYNLIVRVAHPAIELYKKQKKSIMCLNFDDLLVLTRDVLRDYPNIRERIRDKYKFLYIDEYQDTDPIQTEILFYLNGESKDETCPWYQRKLIPGSTFIVGDPKQSIYGFRGADISLYNKVRSVFEKDEDSKLVVLKRNYRTQSGIVEWVEALFKLEDGVGDELVLSDNGSKKFLLNSELGYQANFYGMDPVKYDSNLKEDNLLKGVYGFKPGSEDLNIEDNVLNESLWIARFIEKTVKDAYEIETYDFIKEKTVKRPIKYEDFLIILYRTKYMGNYIRELKDRDIPVSFAGRMRIGDIPEVANFIDLINFLANPLDERLMAAVLTNSYGIKNLEDYTKKDFNTSFGKIKLYDYLSRDLCACEENFVEAITSLRRYLKLKDEYPPIAYLKLIINEILPIFTTRYNSTSLKSIGGTLFYIIEKLSNKNIISFEIAANELTLIKEMDTEKEMILDYQDENDTNHVRIMNLHKAKGLEAPIVILATSSTNKAMGIDTFSKLTENGKEVFFRLKDGFSELGYPASWDEMEKEARLNDNAENLRLQYVATTRAENVLLISEYKKNHWMTYFKDHLPRSLDETFFDKEEVLSPLQVICPSKSKGLLEEFSNLQRKALVECEKETYSYTTPSRQEVEDFTYPKKVYPLAIKPQSLFEGAKWGSLVHRLFEIYLNKVKLPQFNYNLAIDTIEDLFLEFEIEKEFDDYKIKLIDILEKFTTNNTLNELYKPVNIITELSFDRLVGRDYISGIIDLVLICEDGFYIIDYKTNKEWVEEEKFIEFLIGLYKNQLDYYKKVALSIIDKKLLGSFIYSTSIDRFIEI